MKYLVLIGLIALPGCANTTQNAREHYAESIEDCFHHGHRCDTAHKHPLCHGGNVDAETCGVIVYEAEKSDAQRGYGSEQKIDSPAR